MLGKKSISTKSTFSFDVHSDHDSASAQLARQIKSQLENIPSHRDIVVVCIGTDRSTGDSLGPLTGSALKKASLRNFYVYGTLAEPVHAVNLTERLEKIKKHHKQPFIIGIDACLGKLKNIGKVTFSEGPVIPGAAMQKKLPEVGDMHMTGIVNVSGLMEYFVLQNTRLHTVMVMAECISESIIYADKHLKQRSPTPPVEHSAWTTRSRSLLSKAETAFSIHDDERDRIDS